MSDNISTENGWKQAIVNERKVWRAVSRGHELYACAHDVHKNSYDWWITSDKDGKVMTAKGHHSSLAGAQALAIAESRKLAVGSLSTNAFLPSDLHAIKTGKAEKVEGDLQNGRSRVEHNKPGAARKRARGGRSKST